MKIGDFSVTSSSAASQSLYQRADIRDNVIKPTARLSSGYRVTRAADDVAAYAIGSRIRTENAALRQATQNVSRATSDLQIADGVMARQQDLLTRMKVLAVNASSDHLGDSERALLDVEFQALKNEACRIANDTEVNGRHITGSNCNSIIPFEDFSMDFVLATRNPDFATEGQSDANQNNNGFADGGEFVEIDFAFTNAGSTTVDNIQFNNATISDMSLSADPGAGFGGFRYNNSNAFGSLAAGASATTGSGSDLDIEFALGSDGQSFDISLDLYYEIGGTSYSVEVTFGSATIGEIDEGYSMPLKSVVKSWVDDDLVLDPRVGSGILPGEDGIAATLPDLTIDDIHASLPDVTIETLDDAESAMDILDSSLETLVDNRAYVGSLMSRMEHTSNHLGTTIESLTQSEAEYLAADIAKELTTLNNGLALMNTALETLSRWYEGSTNNVLALIRAPDAVAENGAELE